MSNNPIETALGLKDKFLSWVWESNPCSMPFFKRVPVRFIRISIAVLRDMRDGQLNLRAMSLVYTTLLSLVPLLAISFSVLKGFGVHNQIEPMLLNVLEPLGDKRIDIVAKVLEFVDNIKVGVLGSVGLGLLLYSVISLMQKIERAFNYTWQVTRPRSFADRFSDYLSVLLVGPLLVFASMGLTATISNAPIVESLTGVELLGGFFEFIGRVVPYLLIVLAFTFIYIFMPNTKVKPVSALVGGAVSGVMWKTLGWAFATFVAGSAKYAAIYSAFATMILFMIWLYLGWLVILIGASISYYYQNPSSQELPRGEFSLSNRMREKLALLIVWLVGDHYYNYKTPWTIDMLAQKLKTPVRAIERIVYALVENGLLIETQDSPTAYVPAQPFDQVTIYDMWIALRGVGEKQSLKSSRLEAVGAVENVLEEADKAWKKSFSKTTLKDFVMNSKPVPKKRKSIRFKKKENKND